MSSAASNPPSTNGHVASGKAAQPPIQQLPSSLVLVQPARAEDLQPSYAQQIKHNQDNPDAHSWYASFSK
jgi:hypothetical protein